MVMNAVMFLLLQHLTAVGSLCVALTAETVFLVAAGGLIVDMKTSFDQVVFHNQMTLLNIITHTQVKYCIDSQKV